VNPLILSRHCGDSTLRSGIGPYGEIQTKGKEPRHRVHATGWITDTYENLIKMQLAGKTPVSVKKLLADGKIRIEDGWYVRVRN